MSTANPKTFCFVLMPFESTFDDIYNFGIKGACTENDVYCERVDEQNFEGKITDRIVNQINKADFLIADMSGKNPNVFYEVGYAHALNKRIVLLTNNARDIPFDLQDYPHIIYKDIGSLKEPLQKKIAFLKEQGNNVDSSNFPLQLYISGESLEEGTTLKSQGTDIECKITVYNNSPKVVDLADFAFNIVYPKASGPLQVYSQHAELLIPKTRISKKLSSYMKILPFDYSYVDLHVRGGFEYSEIQVQLEVKSASGLIIIPLEFIFNAKKEGASTKNTNL